MNRGKKAGATTSKLPAGVPRQSAGANTSAPSGSAPSSLNHSSASTSGAIQTLIRSYTDNTPARLKLIDAFCVFLMLSGVLQFAYCILVTDFPFNSFIAGFAATVGQFCLAASLRIQANKANAQEYKHISQERAFAEFIFGSVVLHFFVVNFLG